MFSGFRNVVEVLAAPQPRRISQDASFDDPSDSPSRSQKEPANSRSTQSPLSSTELAESALQNLRKSLASRRTASPGQSTSPNRNASHSENDLRPKLNLEERLRATFTIGDVSNATTPSPSPAPPQVPSTSAQASERPLSPASTPLPLSPTLSPAEENHNPLDLTSNPTVEAPPPAIDASAPSAPQDEEANDSDLHLTPIDSEVTKSANVDLGPPPQSPSILPGENPLPNLPSADFDAVQQRLKLVEQRFSDVSMSFKKLQAERMAADQMIRDLTPLEGLHDTNGVRDFLQAMILKAEASRGEIKRLNVAVARQEERLEELRDTHRLESASRSDEVERLRRQLGEAEALILASQSSGSKAAEEADKSKSEITRLEAALERAQSRASEEEEKRTKAVALLKTVRAKLVKAEKEKEEAMKEAKFMRDRENSERDKERMERERLQSEIDIAHVVREKSATNLKTQYEREIASLKDRSEKETLAFRGQFEIDLMSLKSVHAKELASNTSLISTLEKSVKNLSNEKNSFFDQLQLRQAELESSLYHLDSLQTQNAELQHQLREASDRILSLNEELADAHRESEFDPRELAPATENVTHLLYAAETKYEAKIAELRSALLTAERERNEGEAEWSRKCRGKEREVEDVRRLLESSTESQRQKDELADQLRDEMSRLREEVKLHGLQNSEIRAEADKLEETEKALRLQASESNAKLTVFERQLEESRAREAQAKANNKTLREELRKVQSSAALLERQRHHGVGHWSSRHEINIASDPNISPTPPRVGSPTSVSSQSASNEEDINLEYLRNVILQFLEHKEMRPNLVRVLAVILRFTPQETRRLLSKVG